MRALLLRTQKLPSKYGGMLYYAFFKGEDGKSYRSCLHDRCKNFDRWKKFLGRTNIYLDGLKLCKDSITMIDADSHPEELYEKPNPNVVKKQARPSSLKDSQISWQM